MTYVYIISDYHEYGAEQVVATLNRGSLIDLLKKARPNAGTDVDELEKLLQRPDEDLWRDDGNNLGEGWGGTQLHVVKLDEVTDA